jgi:hypothetical protein
MAVAVPPDCTVSVEPLVKVSPLLSMPLLTTVFVIKGYLKFDGWTV